MENRKNRDRSIGLTLVIITNAGGAPRVAHFELFIRVNLPT